MKKLNYKNYYIFTFIIFLSACQSIMQEENKKRVLVDAINVNQEPQEKNKKPQEISSQQALSTLTLPQAPTYIPKEDRFDVAVKDVEVNSFLLGLVDSTKYNLVVSPGLDFNISLQLKNVTVSEVLHTLTQIYPIIVRQNDNLYFVTSAETMTKIYNIDYLNIQRKGDSKTFIAGQSVSGGDDDNSSEGSSNNMQQSSSSNVETSSQTDFWKELNSSLNLIVKNEDKASIVVSPHAGLVVVRALPTTQNLIKEYLKITQNSLDRQVIIEAKILEVRLNDGFQSGVDWSKIGTHNGDNYTLNQAGQIINQSPSSAPINGIFSLLYEGNSFTSAINLLKSQGDVQVLSSPRVSTVNNQKAIIKVGSDEFFVTDISTTTVTGTSTSTTPDVTLTPFFSGISLDVTPQINNNGDIILHVHPIVSEVTDQPKTLSLGEDQFILPLALTNVRESDSIVRSRNGQVIVIGGLMQNSMTEDTTSTPILGDIPLLGKLFTQTRQTQVKSELVILLKAHLVDYQQTNDQLNQIKNRFQQF